MPLRYRVPGPSVLITFGRYRGDRGHRPIAPPALVRQPLRVGPGDPQLAPGQHRAARGGMTAGEYREQLRPVGPLRQPAPRLADLGVRLESVGGAAGEARRQDTTQLKWGQRPRPVAAVA